MTNPARPASPGTISLAALDAKAASGRLYWFDFMSPDGRTPFTWTDHSEADPEKRVKPIRFGVLGGQSEKVTTEVNRLINDRRRLQAEQAAEMANSRSTKIEAQWTPVEDDVAFGQRLSAVRLAAWEGITEDWSPELALALCQSNAEASAQVLTKSNDLTNFMKVSSAT